MEDIFAHNFICSSCWPLFLLFKKYVYNNNNVIFFKTYFFIFMFITKYESNQK